MVYHTVSLFFSIFLEFLQIADILTTETGLKNGLRETNPHWSILIITFKLIFPFLPHMLYVYATRKFNSADQEAGLFIITAFYTTCCLLYIITLINNVTLILSR